MNKTRIDIAKPDIVELFEHQPVGIFKRTDIQQLLSQNRRFWRLAGSTTANEFIAFLLEKTKLVRIVFELPHRRETRFVWGDVSRYELISSLKPDSYFTHYTAMFFHGLTEQIPRTIYLNVEQPVKGGYPEKLEQSNIDRAFKQSPRVSNNIAPYGEQRVCILNGKYTGQLGVISIEDDEGGKIRTTSIERTLIDIAVRPFYAGGVFEVLKAYQLARPKVSVNKMAAMLKKLDYVYPYHQAIGFYMERAGGYEDFALKIIRKFDIEYDFYLTHQMKDTKYDETWRLHYPKGF